MKGNNQMNKYVSVFTLEACSEFTSYHFWPSELPPYFTLFGDMLTVIFSLLVLLVEEQQDGRFRVRFRVVFLEIL